MAMTTPYVEPDCTIAGPNGQQYTSGGAVVTDEYAIGYVTKIDKHWLPEYRVTIETWHGEPLAEWAWVRSSWPVWSHHGDRMYQIVAKINGVWYTGRSMGEGMIWRGKRMADQRGTTRPYNDR